MEQVILVNDNDEPLGTMEKLEAHRLGKLHRAFSVFIFDAKGRMLLQQRAADKYHSASLWSNACCSHPRPGEDTALAARRRLKEEMGMNCELRFLNTFRYKSVYENGLTENELDHIYTGQTDAQPHPDPNEVSDFAWKELAEIREEVIKKPGDFTTWFRIAMDNFF